MSRSIVKFGLLALVVLGLTGCVNSQGERVTMWDWWRSRSAPHRGEPPPPGDQSAAAKAQNEPRAQPTEDPAASHERGSTAPHAASNVPRALASEANPQSSGRNPKSNAPARLATADEPPPASAIESDGLLVNDETISVNDILEPIHISLKGFVHDLAPENYYEKAGLLVRQQIVEAVAQHLIWRRAKLQITDEMKPNLDKVVEKTEKERINREFGGRETMYEKYISQHGKTRSEVRERIRRSVVIDTYLRERLLQVVPSPRKAELLSYYKEHRRDFNRVGRREMYLIDIPVAVYLDPHRPPSPEEIQMATDKARQDIDAAAAALKAGDKFEDVARKYSQGLHTSEGGFWGFISAADDGKSPPLQGRWTVPSQKLFEMKKGEVSGIIEASKAFFIIMVGKVEAGKAATFQEAQPEIATTLRQQQFIKKRAEFLQSELDRSTIGSLDAFVEQVLRAIPKPEKSTAAAGPKP